MMRPRHLLLAGALMFVGLGCQAPAVPVSPAEALPTETPADTTVQAPASAVIWGEVPKQCA